MSTSSEPLSGGRFITFEGIDGAGKSSHIGPLANYLSEKGHEVIVTREPGGSAVAEALRDLMLASAMQPTTELLLAFAARAEHLHHVIRPALARRAWVLCDRFTDSTFAYQAGGRDLPWSQVQMLEALVHPELQPDLTLWFDLDPAEAAQRRQAARAADRFEAEDLVFFEQVRAAYVRRASEHAERIVRIDAAGAFETIQSLLKEIILKY